MIEKVKKEKARNILIIIVVSSFIVVAIGSIIGNEKTITTSTLITGTQKIEWGIKRNKDNKQPDVGITNKALLEKNNGICMGNDSKPYIYITFDEGYESGYTSKILDTLKDNDIKATFFITGHYLNSATDIVKRMIDEGHIVGNHTVNHKSMPEINEGKLKEEVMNLHNSVKEKFNYKMKYLRPPKGEFSESSLIQTNALGYKTVMWSFAYADWDEKNQPSEQEGKEKILNNLHNGEIVLLHATSRTNTNILDEVIKEIKNKGFEFKSLDEFEK